MRIFKVSESEHLAADLGIIEYLPDLEPVRDFVNRVVEDVLVGTHEYTFDYGNVVETDDVFGELAFETAKQAWDDYSPEQRKVFLTALAGAAREFRHIQFKNSIESSTNSAEIERAYHDVYRLHRLLIESEDVQSEVIATALMGLITESAFTILSETVRTYVEKFQAILVAPIDRVKVEIGESDFGIHTLTMDFYIQE